MKYKISASEMRERIKTKLSHYFGVQPDQASDEHYYKAVVLIIKDLLNEGRKKFTEKAAAQDTKQVFYLCMEFLMGRSLKNNLYNLGLEKSVEKALADFDVKLDSIYDQEPDPGLGNGGLGRLAACFLDGLATQGYPATGYCICYEYGIFRQRLEDGWQIEMPDFWLPGGEVWLNPHPEEQIEVRFDGNIRDWWDGQFHQVVHENYTSVFAVPYDLMVSGKDGNGVSLLRLWKATAPVFNLEDFQGGHYLKAMEQKATAEAISQVLYPVDEHHEGKSLRLRQQYFLVSASIQDIVRQHLSDFGTLDNLPDKAAIHTNDTHPVLAIPELMRILLDECGYTWDNAWDIVSRTIAYTNHTVMSEALECWPVDLFKARLPRIYQIVIEIDNRHRKKVWEMSSDAGLVERTAIIHNGFVHMANLAVAACHSVNGVSELHSEILKDKLFADTYRLEPQKFKNVTNGIAHRRWLNQSNPELASFVTELIGDGYIRDAGELSNLRKFADDKQVLERLAKIKRSNKERLADYILRKNGIQCNPDSIFDIQVKRLHEYKRQHLNALHILSQYQWIKANPNADFTPKTYIFGAKAATSYKRAKELIQFIVDIAELVNNDPDVKDKLKVVFIEDYRVTLAELIIPAAEISEQISQAGTEASGTSNMKLMLNGAITLGTEDGANVEIHRVVGDDNILIFGMNAEEVASLKNMGYDPNRYLYNNSVLKKSIDILSSGIGRHQYRDLAGSVTSGDRFMVLADFDDYCRAQARASELYRKPEVWNRMSLINIAGAGIFAADRSINDYARDIWHATPVRFSNK